MTTIVYNDAVLAADSRAVTGNSTTYIVDQIKATVSKSKFIAYGISGRVIPVEDRPALEIELLSCVLKATSKAGYKEPLSDELSALLDGRDFIIMTRTHVFTRAENGGARSLSRLLPGEYVAIGTGREIATVAMTFGYTAVKAIEHAIKHDFFTYPGAITTIQQSKLKPLPLDIKS